MFDADNNIFNNIIHKGVPNQAQEDDPFNLVGDVNEQFGQMNFNEPLSNTELNKAQANIENILGDFTPSSTVP